jgi:hypothetical protein
MPGPLPQQGKDQRLLGQEDISALLDYLVDLLADRLAPRLAEHLNRDPSAPDPALTTARLITLDQLISLLPPSKPARTWKSWLYQHTRRGRVPGAVKLAGRLYFDPDQTLNWLQQGAPTKTGSSCQTEQQSPQAMHDAPITQPRRDQVGR